MKKILMTIAAILCLICSVFSFAACGEGKPDNGGSTGNGGAQTEQPDGEGQTPKPDEKAEYTVSFDSKEGSSVPSQKVKEGEILVEPKDPTKEGYSFDGWYSDENFAEEWNFNNPVTKSMTLYAKWLLDPKGINYELVNDYYRVISYVGQSTEVVIPNNYDGKPVKEISEYAFQNCSGFTSVKIGENVQTIGASAFNNCSGLMGELKIPDNVISIGESAFNGCIRLESVTIGAQTIGNSAFKDCSGLTSVTIGDNIHKIGSSAFQNCSKLEKVTISNLSAWCKIYFENSIANPLYYVHHLYLNNEEIKDLVIPTDITEIKQYAFSGCSGLTSVTIGKNVQTIGNSAFYNCSGLTGELKIPDSVQSIGNSAFYNCSGLTGELKIPDSVQSIGDYAFYNCSGLISVTIGENVQTIGDEAFCQCSGLENVTIGNNVTSIGYEAFYGCSGLTEITIPNNVISIGEFAFYNCREAKEIKISESVTSIGYAAFGGCSALQSITLPFVGGSKDATEASSSTLFGYIFGRNSYDGGVFTEQYYNAHYYIPKNLTAVTIIGRNILYGAFSYCIGLEKVTIGENVQTIGDFAFYGCSGLKFVYYKGTSDQWGKISIAEYNYYLISATRYYFSEQDPYQNHTAKDGEQYWHYGNDGKPEVWTKKENQ